MIQTPCVGWSVRPTVIAIFLFIKRLQATPSAVIWWPTVPVAPGTLRFKRLLSLGRLASCVTLAVTHGDKKR
jgi:hypothetical protein